MLYLSKGGVLHKYPFYLREEAAGVITDNYIAHLNDWFDLDPAATFKDFLTPVFQHPEVYSALFCSHLGNLQLDVFTEEFNLPPFQALKDLDRLQISWEIDFETNPNHVPPLPGKRPEHPASFFSATPIVDGYCLANNQTYAIDFLSINDLNPLPLVLNPIFQISTEPQPSSQYLLSAVNPFTVYDALVAVLCEISFYGPPTDRREAEAELNRRLKDP